jgi:hypothetical protein
MQWLTDLIQTILKTPGRIGLVLAVAAGALVYFRSIGVEAVAAIPEAYVHYSILGGLVGGAAAALSLIAHVSAWAWRKAKANGRKFKKSIVGIENLNSGYKEYLDVVHYLYVNDIRRFAGRRDNSLLSSMVTACILEIDDPPGAYYSNETYFVVPSLIWKHIKRNATQLQGRPVPQTAPWKTFERRGWIV